jgi:uracil-DNA glycosylase family 4
MAKIKLNDNDHTQVRPLSHTSLHRSVRGAGPSDAKILVLGETPSWNDPSTGRPLSDHFGRLLFNELNKAGIRRDQVRVEVICEKVPPNRKFSLLDWRERVMWLEDALDRVASSEANVIVPMGEEPLRLCTDKRSVSKWNLSILEGTGVLKGRKVIPLYAPEYFSRVYKEIPFLTFGAQRIAEEMSSPEVRREERNYIVKPSLEQSLDWIERHMDSEWMSLDIETGAGQITCIGFAADSSEAISIPTWPKEYSPEDHYKLWRAIAKLCAAPSRKVMQNGIYDVTYLSRYGIRVRNHYHDTMVCQKLLHPELNMGLDTVARLYTREPYWKDDGKNWGLKQDVSQLYYYNAKDVALTLEAAHAQRLDLKKRGLSNVFRHVMRFHAPACEMAWRGLPLRETKLLELRKETQNEITRLESILAEESKRVIGREINPRSVPQKKELLKACGYRLPVKKGKESTDYESLLKLQLKDPESPLLGALIRLSGEQKKLSSYLNFKYDEDKRVRFTHFIHGTETGRFSCKTDPWGKGLNVQTIPSGLKEMFGYDG